MLLTQRQTIQRLRDRTGRSLEWCTASARKLAKVQDGKRMKVRELDMEIHIAFANDIAVAQSPPPGVRPISSRKIARIRERC